MKNTVFKGMATAIVTPMTENGIDYEALGRFIEFQIENGINAIVVMGTTGENATIEPEDQTAVIRFTVEKVAGRVPVVAGTGTNDTSHVLRNTVNACQAGADAVLVVTPYYNKATQNGLIAHFTAVADASTKPVILYNVPSRTSCNLLPKTVADAQSGLTLCDPMDCSLPGSPLHEILQARILEWAVVPFSRGSSQLRDHTLGLLNCSQIVYHLSRQGLEVPVSSCCQVVVTESAHTATAEPRGKSWAVN